MSCVYCGPIFFLPEMYNDEIFCNIKNLNNFKLLDIHEVHENLFKLKLYKNNAKPHKGIYLLNGLYYVNVLQNLVNVPQAHSNKEGK